MGSGLGSFLVENEESHTNLFFESCDGFKWFIATQHSEIAAIGDSGVQWGMAYLLLFGKLTSTYKSLKDFFQFLLEIRDDRTWTINSAAG